MLIPKPVPAITAFLVFTAFSAHASLMSNSGFECGSAESTASGYAVNSASSLCNWNQWSNSGAEVVTARSAAYSLEGGASAHVTGGDHDGLFQYGNFAAGVYTASAWFYVVSGSAELGLYFAGGSEGFEGSATAATGRWEYVTTTATLLSGPMGPSLYGSDANSEFFVDAFWLNAGETSTNPYDPATGFDPNRTSYVDLPGRELPAPPEPELPAVPEPGTLGLMGLGLLALASRLRRR